MTGRAIKLPVYEILAARHGLDYAPLVPTLPVSQEAKAALFGGELAAESFTDFFSGKLLDGADFLTCQGYVLGENNARFNGRLFAFTRLHGVDGHTLLTPDCPALLDLRRRGKLRLYAGPGEILVAIEGRKGFTPGLGFRFRRAEDRIRWMFDDLADSLALLNRLKAALDGGL